jgi:hypothetical protein
MRRASAYRSNANVCIVYNAQEVSRGWKADVSVELGVAHVFAQESIWVEHLTV